MGKIYETLIGKELDTMQLGAVTYEVHAMVTGMTAWRHSRPGCKEGLCRWNSCFEEIELIDQGGLCSQDTES